MEVGSTLRGMEGPTDRYVCILATPGESIENTRLHEKRRSTPADRRSIRGGTALKDGNKAMLATTLREGRGQQSNIGQRMAPRGMGIPHECRGSTGVSCGLGADLEVEAFNIGAWIGQGDKAWSKRRRDTTLKLDVGGMAPAA
ncbi:hypothetical protein LIER_19811 [Lithospermum erythrorhizon]|uniref:Uncharacterized protein n=1 Tax=Lithospermum erythrorhizon TaxID=34254 RepID=A0AAV3QK15_LITER